MITTQRIASLTVSAIVAAVLLLGFNAIPARAQKPVKDRTVYEAEYTMVNPCNGEMMTVTDRYLVTIFSQDNQNGCGRLRFHINDMGSKAVGESGSRYQFPWAENTLVSFSCDGCTYEETHVMTVQLVGQGKAPNFKLKMNIRVIYNWCTDELTVIRMSTSTTCDGEPI